MLWSWLSLADCVRLVTAALTAPRVGFSVIYGTSDNAAGRRLQRPRQPHRLPAAGQRRRLRRGGHGGHAPPRSDRHRQPRGRRRLRRHRPSRRCRLRPPASPPRSPPPGPPPRRVTHGPLDAAPRRGRREPRLRRHPGRPAGGPRRRPRPSCAPGASAPLFRIRPGEEALDALLAARGYVVRDPTLILAAPVAAIAGDPGEAAIFGPAPARLHGGDLGRGRHRPGPPRGHGPGAGAARLPPRPPRRPSGRRGVRGVPRPRRHAARPRGRRLRPPPRPRRAR